MSDQPHGWCLVRFLDHEGTALAQYAIGGSGPPDISTVDLLARLALQARRLGVELVVEDVSEELAGLLGLAALPFEVRGKAEHGEQPVGLEDVQEEAHPGDLPP